MSESSEFDRRDGPTGHVEFDDRGNAIWKTDQACDSEDSLVLKMLDASELSIDEDVPRAPTASAARLEIGFDPYSSGCVVRDPARRKRTDLRALSEEIKRKRQA